MSRIDIPSANQAHPASIPLLEAVTKKLGVTPNLMKMIGHSPAALEGYLSLNAALGKGTIGGKTAERIALAIAETNSCEYCLSAHSYLAKNVAKLDEAEMAANREGKSTDAKAAAAVHFAIWVAQDRGHVADAELQAVKAAGYTDAEVIEIVLYVALNVLTNYVNNVAKTDIDFPVVHVKSNLK